MRCLFFSSRSSGRSNNNVTVHLLYNAISSLSHVLVGETLFFACVTTARFVLSQTRRARRGTLDRSFFLRSRSINPDEPTAFLASEIGKWFRDLEISPGRPSESRADWRTREDGTVLTVGCTSIPHVLWNRFPIYRFPIELI